MENPIKMDDLGGKPTIFGSIHIILNSLMWGMTFMWISMVQASSGEVAVRYTECVGSSMVLFDWNREEKQMKITQRIHGT